MQPFIETAAQALLTDGEVPAPGTMFAVLRHLCADCAEVAEAWGPVLVRIAELQAEIDTGRDARPARAA